MACRDVQTKEKGEATKLNEGKQKAKKKKRRQEKGQKERMKGDEPFAARN
jgi:hypothetical protein